MCHNMRAIVLLAIAPLVASWMSAAPGRQRLPQRRMALTASLAPPPTHEATRYVATNRFLVSKDEEAAFELGWAQRKLRLAEAEGFRYFQMGKRAADFMGPPLAENEPTHVSYCVFDTKAAFEAFEASADGGLAATGGEFAGEPAFYDGLFTLALPPAEQPEVVDGWRTVAPKANGKLPREAFVASNRFGIKPGFEGAFESMWAGRDSSLAELPGFVNFQLLRRVGAAADDGNQFISYTTWADAQSFNGWRQSDNFKRSHSNSGGAATESPYAKMPKVVTYKCFLVLSSDEGL